MYQQGTNKSKKRQICYLFRATRAAYLKRYLRSACAKKLR